LHAPTDSTVLQRGDSESKLFNTSAIDIEHPSAAYEELKYVECVLMPGDMLYIPPRWWHYVRALDASASVSFWFQ
jgi:lysine-specific demethylase 8